MYVQVDVAEFFFSRLEQENQGASPGQNSDFSKSTISGSRNHNEVFMCIICSVTLEGCLLIIHVDAHPKATGPRTL
jgi:hypothetical protein